MRDKHVFCFLIFVVISIWFLFFKYTSECGISITEGEIIQRENVIKLSNFAVKPTINIEPVRTQTVDDKLNLKIQFRKGNIDWHYLIKPTTNQVEKKHYEKTLVQLLTANEKRPFYEFCPFISDACILYDDALCKEHAMCYWCDSKSICVSKFNSEKNHNGTMCPEGYDLSVHSGPGFGNGWVYWPYRQFPLPSDTVHECAYFIPQRVVSLDFFVMPNSIMFYHFVTESLPFIFNSTTENPDEILFVYSNRYVKDIVDEYAEYFSLFSSNCAIDVENIPKNVCFQLFEHSIPPRDVHSVPKVILNRFGLLDVRIDTTKHPKFCLIQRANKRLILNDLDLLLLAEGMGFESVELILEEMRLEEQLQTIRQCSVLAGVHGSGLSNVIFMNSGTTLIQIVPYKVCKAHHFIKQATRAQVRYLEWTNQRIENTVFHQHFLPKGTDLKTFVASVECSNPDSEHFFSFWINQDTIVDLEEFSETLQLAKHSLT